MTAAGRPRVDGDLRDQEPERRGEAARENHQAPELRELGGTPAGRPEVG